MQAKRVTTTYNSLYDGWHVKSFYQMIPKYEKMQALTPEKIAEIDQFLNAWLSSVTYQNCKTIRERYYKTIFYLQNYLSAAFDEKAYFLVKAVDPDLELLEMYVISNTKAELKQNLQNAYGFIPLQLVLIEKDYQKLFMPDKKLDFGLILEKRENQIKK